MAASKTSLLAEMFTSLLLHEGLMDAILHVHGDVQEVNYLLVGSDGDGKIEIPEHLADFLLQNFVLSGCFV